MGDSKKIVPGMEVYEDDGYWMWVAFAPNCRLIVAFIIGPRKQYVADELVKITYERLSEILLQENVELLIQSGNFMTF